MKTFTQYYTAERYYIWQTIFAAFLVFVFIAIVNSGEPSAWIALPIAAAPSILWLVRAHRIYKRLVRLIHSKVAPEGAEYYKYYERTHVTFYKIVDGHVYSYFSNCWHTSAWKSEDVISLAIFKNVPK